MSAHDERLAAQAKASGLQEWQVRAAETVGTDLVRSLVSDFRRPVSQNQSMVLPDKTPERETWRNRAAEVPLTPPASVALLDRIAESFAQVDRAALLKERLEAELITRLEAQAKK